MIGLFVSATGSQVRPDPLCSRSTQFARDGGATGTGGEPTVVPHADIEPPAPPKLPPAPPIPVEPPEPPLPRTVQVFPGRMIIVTLGESPLTIFATFMAM